METAPTERMPTECPAPWYTLISRPTAFFETRKNKINWISITIVSTVLSAIGVILQVPYMMKLIESQRQIAMMQHGAQIPEQITAALDAFTKGVMYVSGFASPWVQAFGFGFVIWLLVQMFGGKLRYMNGVGIAANIHFITIVLYLFAGIFTVSTGNTPIGFLSINMLVHAPGHIGGLLSVISVTWVWTTILLYIALTRMTTLSRNRVLWMMVIDVVLSLLLGLAGSTNGISGTLH